MAMTGSRSFDVICLGTGPAASTVATICAKAGLSVAVIESREFGGTCALRGCNPKKVFTNAAALVDQFQRACGQLSRGNSRIEWPDLIAFQHRFTDPVREQTEDKLQKLGIETVHGMAQFECERVIRVGEQRFEGANIFLGVGARPASLNIPGEDLAVTSDDFMELPSLPGKVLFLGGGYIAFEFACVAARASSKVKIVDRHELPLKSFDPNLVQMLIESAQASGIEVHTKTEATAIERTTKGLQIQLTTPSGSKIMTADLVVNAGGRVPNLDEMNLHTGRVAYGKRGVTVNEFLQSTTNPSVYAAGDCADAGVPMLTPTANGSARVAAMNILADRRSESASTAHRETEFQEKQKADYGPVPTVVFCVPPLAAVGLSETEADKQGFNVDVRFDDLSMKGEVRKLCAPTAGCKILIDRKTDQILGAHVLGPHADDVINLFSLAIRFHLTATNLKSSLFSYPTMTAEYLRVL